MSARRLIGLAAALLPAVASAERNIKFINHCPYDIYSWTVGPAGSHYTGHDNQAVTIAANTVTYHPMINSEEAGGGISLKLRDLPKYQVAPAGIIQLEYTLAPSQNHLWYDLSAVDCNHAVGPEHPSFCPLIRSGLQVYVEHAQKGTCPPAWCGADAKCHNMYKERGHWQGEPTFKCDAAKDVVVEFCTERAGPRTFNGQKEPGHYDPRPVVRPGTPTKNGVCGAKSSGGEVCFGYAHGGCCSQYGWCGSSDAHCGTGCQAGYGDCKGEAVHKHSSYSAYHKPSTFHSVYSKARPSYVSSKHVPSYQAPSHSPAPKHSSTAVHYTPPSSYSAPAPAYYPVPSSHQTSHKSSSHYSKPAPSYKKPSHHEKPTASYEKPSHHSKPTFSYEKPSSHLTPGWSYAPPTPSWYTEPMPGYVPASHGTRPSHKMTAVYSRPTPAYEESSSYKKPTSHPTHVKPSYKTSAVHSKPTPSYSRRAVEERAFYDADGNLWMDGQVFSGKPPKYREPGLPAEWFDFREPVMGDRVRFNDGMMQLNSENVMERDVELDEEKRANSDDEKLGKEKAAHVDKEGRLWVDGAVWTGLAPEVKEEGTPDEWYEQSERA